MDRGPRILVFFLALLAFLGALAFIASAALGVTLGTSGATTTKYRVSCDGVIDVPAVDTAFTNPTIKQNSCTIEACNRLGFSIFGDPFAQEGNIQLLVNGAVLDSASWTSSFGSDQDYQLSTSCIPKPASATVKVRDSTGTITDSATEDFS